MAERRIEVKSPASIANLGPLFDYAAMAIDYKYDRVSVQVVGEGSIRIETFGSDNTANQIAYHAAYALLQESNEQLYIRVYIEKNVPLTGGLGGGGPLAAAVVYGLNQILGEIFTPIELVQIAGRAQSIVAGEPHYETAAASLYGGLVFLEGRPPENVARMEPPEWLRILLFIPCGELASKLSIRRMREILPREVSLPSALDWLGASLQLIISLQRGEWKKAFAATARGGPIEEFRAKHIPGYYLAKKTALSTGALGFNISGAGPTVFAIVEEENAEEVKDKVLSILSQYWDCINAEIVKPRLQGIEPL